MSIDAAHAEQALVCLDTILSHSSPLPDFHSKRLVDDAAFTLEQFLKEVSDNVTDVSDVDDLMAALELANETILNLKAKIKSVTELLK